MVEGLARRAGSGSDRPGVPPPRWLKTASFVAITAFYLLIAPTGSSLAGGWGNAAGIALAATAMVLRFVVRRGVDTHSVLDAAREVLEQRHGLRHATLQVEPEDHTGCDELSW